MAWDLDPDPMLLLVVGDEKHLARWMHLVTTEFYRRVFADPILEVLFVEKSDHHATRLSQFLTMMCGGSVQYIFDRCPIQADSFQAQDVHLCVDPFGTVHGRHWHAQQLHARDEAPPGAGQAGKAFTTSQRDVWMSHMLAAVRYVKCPFSDFEARFVNLLERAMERYGPFAPDRQQEGGDSSYCSTHWAQEEDDDELAELHRQQDAFRASGRAAAASLSRQPQALQSPQKDLTTFAGHINRRAQAEAVDDEFAELLKQQDAFRARGEIAAASVSRQPKAFQS